MWLCHHFILLILSCSHGMEELLFYISWQFSTAGIISGLQYFMEPLVLWQGQANELKWCAPSINSHSWLSCYLLEPGLYFRHLSPAAAASNFAHGWLVKPFWQPCQDVRLQKWEKSLSTMEQPAKVTPVMAISVRALSNTTCPRAACAGLCGKALIS